MIAVFRLVCVSTCLLLLCASGAASAAPPAGFVPLREAREPALQAALEESLAKLGLSGLVKQKKLAITLAGITDPECPRFAGFNGNVMMYAASMPKLAILLAAFKRIEDGDLVLDAELTSLMTRMIRYSSNTAATEVMDRVGREFIAEVLESKELGLYDRKLGGGLWVGRAYAKRPAWRRDPLNNLSHGATTMQVARLYYLLESGRLLPPELSARMREMLSQPGVEHKFVAGIHAKFPGASFLRKSGTWRNYHADSAVISHGGKRYIAVAMLESEGGEALLRELVLELDSLIFHIPPHCPTELPETQPLGASPH